MKPASFEYLAVWYRAPLSSRLAGPVPTNAPRAPYRPSAPIGSTTVALESRLGKGLVGRAAIRRPWRLPRLPARRDSPAARARRRIIALPPRPGPCQRRCHRTVLVPARARTAVWLNGAGFLRSAPVGSHPNHIPKPRVVGSNPIVRRGGLARGTRRGGLLPSPSATRYFPPAAYEGRPASAAEPCAICSLIFRKRAGRRSRFRG